MRVALVTGRTELGCGVADYSVRLATALEDAGARVDLVTRDTWGTRAVGATRRDLDALRPDIVHLQYPTASYRTSLAPHALALVAPPRVLTLHEASQAHPLRQLSLLALTARPRWVLFTTPFERDHLLRLAPWIRRRSSVLPIGSTIPAAPHPVDTSGAATVVYFGLLTPEKGLDDVLALAERAQERPGTRVLIVGRAEPRHPDLPGQLQKRSRSLPVDWAVDLDAEQVASRLASAAVGYLPFPDGASERRSSLLALLVNGVATVTTPGPFVDAELAEAVELVEGTDAAWAATAHLLDDGEARDALAGRALRYGRARNWEDIARRHLELYDRLLSSGSRSRSRTRPRPPGERTA